MSGSQRWRRRPEGSTWGDFGADDQLGSLNHITPEAVLRAVRSVTEGRRFCLSLPLDYPGGSALAPHRGPPELTAGTRRGRPYYNYSFREEAPGCGDVGCDDRVSLSPQYSTQWDGLAHIGQEFDLLDDGRPRPCYYNGYQAGSDVLPPGARPEGYVLPLGVDAMAATPIQGRGLLLDLAHHYGRAKRELGFREIERVLACDGLSVEPGDLLCLHTGFADELLKMGRKPDPARLHGICAALDGRDRRLLDWIAETRIAAIAADNFAVERVGLPPAAEGEPAFVPLHRHCLFRLGLPLGELWHLTPLAAWLRAAGRFHFLLTAPPLRLPGAVGSPVTPVATV